jgi:hypothetical protein
MPSWKAAPHCCVSKPALTSSQSEARIRTHRATRRRPRTRERSEAHPSRAPGEHASRTRAAHDSSGIFSPARPARSGR